VEQDALVRGGFAYLALVRECMQCTRLFRVPCIGSWMHWFVVVSRTLSRPVAPVSRSAICDAVSSPVRLYFLQICMHGWVGWTDTRARIHTDREYAPGSVCRLECCRWSCILTYADHLRVHVTLSNLRLSRVILSSSSSSSNAPAGGRTKTRLSGLTPSTWPFLSSFTPQRPFSLSKDFNSP
jgi:hypothetical protein